jgi:hypothetical protein
MVNEEDEAKFRCEIEPIAVAHRLRTLSRPPVLDGPAGCWKLGQALDR